MRLMRISTTPILAIVAVGIAAGAAQAAPAPAPAPKAPNTTISLDPVPGVHYQADISDHSVVLGTGAGTLTTRGGQFQVQDSQKKVVLGQPLTTGTDTSRWPNAAKMNGPAAGGAQETARVPAPAPVRTAAAAIALALPLHRVDDDKTKDPKQDFNDAVGVAANQIGLATGIGSMAGGAIGIAIGCPVGAVTGGLVAAPTIVGSPVLAALGCVVGAGTGAGLGAAIGGMALGVPVGVASGVEMYNTLHAKGEA